MILSNIYHTIYGLLNILTGILDYLREGFPWPARPFKHTQSNSLNIRQLHLYKYVYELVFQFISYFLRGVVVWPALHILKCPYRIIYLSLSLSRFVCVCIIAPF
jgi:hypothetical protein